MAGTLRILNTCWFLFQAGTDCSELQKEVTSWLVLNDSVRTGTCARQVYSEQPGSELGLFLPHYGARGPVTLARGTNPQVPTLP